MKLNFLPFPFFAARFNSMSKASRNSLSGFDPPDGVLRAATAAKGPEGHRVPTCGKQAVGAAQGAW